MALPQPTPVIAVDTETEWLQILWNDHTPLVIGQTYAYMEYRYGPEGLWGHFPVLVTLTKKARQGVDGERAECDDGLNRYSSGRYRGRFRYDQHKKAITHRRNPNYIPQAKPHVQLSLFDFEAETS